MRVINGATIFDNKDNVATAGISLPAGTEFRLDGRVFSILQPIASGHKIALFDIEAGQDILKYGEVMGRSTAPIKAGEHVHVHNVESLRGRGDLCIR